MEEIIEKQEKTKKLTIAEIEKLIDCKGSNYMKILPNGEIHVREHIPDEVFMILSNGEIRLEVVE